MHHVKFKFHRLLNDPVTDKYVYYLFIYLFIYYVTVQIEKSSKTSYEEIDKQEKQASIIEKTLLSKGI